MKKFRNILLLCVCAFITLVLTGCGTKTALSAEEFKTTMESKGYTVTDATSQFADYSYITTCYVATDSSEAYQIEFYVFTDSNYATSFYDNNKTIFENSKGTSDTETLVSLKNYSKYTLETNGMFKTVSRIDNTVTYLNVDSSYKATVKDILTELNY